MKTATEIKSEVSDYYGKTLQSSDDLLTTACCDDSSISDWMKPILSNIHDEVLARYYGCGLVCPELLQGKRILDLGSGSGRDVYALAQLVGPEGEVVGVDMTDEQLAIAEKFKPYHAEKFGYDNVRFLKGDIEQLEHLDLARNSFDVVVSNCVINLVNDKSKVLADIHSLLKPGGEFYFSDVYCNRRVPEAVRNDPVVYGECLGGALYYKDFERAAHSAGFLDPRLCELRVLTLKDANIEAKTKGLVFYSATYRLFKIDALETACEDYGQAVRYKGGIAHEEHSISLDGHHLFEKGRIVPVCGNTYLMLKSSRYEPYFEFYGDFDQHFGLFPGCGETSPFVEAQLAEDTGCC